jgi:hypothetical protein
MRLSNGRNFATRALEGFGASDSDLRESDLSTARSAPRLWFHADGAKLVDQDRNGVVS